ncbi:MAG: S9 family peptidase [Rhodoferax sp.]|nr:S9 family peptidase [Rhodoferax sp.]
MKMDRRTAMLTVGLGAMEFAYGQADMTKPDAAAFFRANQMMNAVLSPDASRLAMRTVGPHGRVVLTVLDLATMESAVAYSSDGADVDRVAWVNNSRLVFTMADLEVPQKEQDSGPGLFGVNPDGSDFRQLVERQGIYARNASTSRNLEPWNTFLQSSTYGKTGDDVFVARPESYEGKDVGYIKLLRLNTKRPQVKEVEGPLHSTDWWLDTKGELRAAATREGEKAALRWKDPATGAWKVLDEFNAYTDGGMQVKHIGADGKLYIASRRNGDKQALWLLDPATGSWSAEPLVQSQQFDINPWVIATQDKVLGYRYRTDKEQTQWLEPELQALQKQIDKVLPRSVNRLSFPWQGNAPWVLIEVSSDVQPWQFFLFNRETKKFTRLGGQRPDIDAKKMAGKELVRISARDSLTVPAWLTVPQGAERKNLPMVVLVHGGPFSPGAHWNWDAEVQFLAARGYAVLQPEFRGTMGFGEAHYKAGWRQWGKGMQTDVADAARWAIAQGIADPKRIAIAGASYGGYATLMGLVRDPDLFRCGVAWVGVTDLDMLHTVSWDDISDDFKKQGMPKLVGDRVRDAADLKENSPLTHAAKITQPLLLAYGGEDQRVPIIHGNKFRSAVQTANSKVEWVVYDQEGHGWRLPANKVDFWNRVAKFLDKNLA